MAKINLQGINMELEFWRGQSKKELDRQREYLEKYGSLENNLVFKYYVDDPDRLQLVDLTPSGVDRQSLQYDAVLDEPSELVTFTNYQAGAMLTANTVGNYNHDLSNAALGLAGELSEVIEPIKKHLYHDKPLDREALAKEIGDVLYYLAWIAEIIKHDLGAIAQMNREKLKARHPNGFNLNYTR